MADPIEEQLLGAAKELSEQRKLIKQLKIEQALATERADSAERTVVELRERYRGALETSADCGQSPTSSHDSLREEIDLLTLRLRESESRVEEERSRRSEAEDKCSKYESSFAALADSLKELVGPDAVERSSDLVELVMRAKVEVEAELHAVQKECEAQVAQLKAEHQDHMRETEQRIIDASIEEHEELHSSIVAEKDELIERLKSENARLEGQLQRFQDLSTTTESCEAPHPSREECEAASEAPHPPTDDADEEAPGWLGGLFRTPRRSKRLRTS